MTVLNALGGWLICDACLRIRVSPAHGLCRMLGVCPGDRGHHSWG